MSIKIDLPKLYKEAFEKIKEEALINKVEIIDENYTNGYYIFEMGDNSVVHFKIKGCKNWLFGCWFDYDKKKKSYPIKVELFCQHERYLDKFKPSRGAYCISTSINITDGVCNIDNTIEAIDAGFIYQLVKICRFIHKHPYLAYYKDVCWACDYNYERQKPVKSFFRYYKDGIYDWWRDLICNYLNNKLLKFVKEYAIREFSDYNWEMLDEGEDCWPRYTLRVELPDNEVQSTGIFDLFNADEDQKAWNNLNAHCQKISDICKVYWYSNISDYIIFWNKKEWESYINE